MSKSGSLSSEQFTWDVASGLPLLLQDGQASFIYGPGGMLLAEIKTADSSVYYYHQDRLGSVRALTTSTGSVAKRYEYDAYGNQTLPSFSLAYNPFGYTGEYTDQESGLIYLRARYYDPSTQQFLTVDPLLAQTEEAYAYVGGNPLNATDPSGQCPFCPLILAGAVVGAGVGGILYGVNAAITGQEFTAEGLAGAMVGGAIAGGIGVVAAPIAGALGLGTGVAGMAVVNTGAGVLAYGAQSAIDPGTRFTPEGAAFSGLFGAAGGFVGSTLSPTRGMSNFRQVGFPRTWAGVTPTQLGGRVQLNAPRTGPGTNARNAIYTGGGLSVGVGFQGPFLGQFYADRFFGSSSRANTPGLCSAVGP